MRVVLFATAFLALGVAISNGYSVGRTICPSSMTSCDCTTMARGVFVTCNNFSNRGQLLSTMHDLRGYRLHQFSMVNCSLEMENGDFSNVTLYNMDVDSSQLFVKNVHEGFLVETDNNLRSLKFYNSVIDFGETVSESTKLSTLWFKRCTFRNYREEWFEGLSVEWLRIENCKQMHEFVASRLGKLKRYSHINSDLTELTRAMLPFDSHTIEELDFSFNNISSISDDFLVGLTSLQKLDLSDNRLETLNEKTFENFDGVLVLSNNPLKCNSSLLWLAQRLNNGSLPQPYRLTCFDEDGRRRSIRDLARTADDYSW